MKRTTLTNGAMSLVRVWIGTCLAVCLFGLVCVGLNYADTANADTANADDGRAQHVHRIPALDQLRNEVGHMRVQMRQMRKELDQLRAMHNNAGPLEERPDGSGHWRHKPSPRPQDRKI